MRPSPARQGYRIDAKRQWRGLTTADLSEIRNEEQLIAVVKVRCSLTYEKAKADVETWMSGKQFRPRWSIRIGWRGFWPVEVSQ